MSSQSRPDPLTNVDAVTYALAQLQGGHKPVHLELIAVKAHELAPGSFRWDLDEFAEFVDKDKVRVSLTDAEKPDKGALVEGVGVRRSGQSKRSDLWRLTANGAKWLRENEERVRAGTATPTPRFKKGKADALRRRVTASKLYREFEEVRTVTPDPYAFTDLLECSPDAADSIVAQRFDDLQAQVQMLEDQDLLAFLAACAEAHSDMLGRG
jgi:hypothetical protein